MQKKEIVRQVEEILEAKVRPALKLHAGGIEVIDFDEKSGTLFVELQGACEGCGFADETLFGFIEEELLANIPDIQEVALAESHNRSIGI